MAAPAASIVRGAVWHQVAVRLSQDACDRPVDLDCVCTMAKAFHCHEIVEVHSAARECNSVVVDAADAVANALPGKGAVKDAVKQSTTAPVGVEGSPGVVSMANGSRRFKTSRIGMWQDLWTLYHPGGSLVAEFYSALSDYSDANLHTEALYGLASRIFSSNKVEECVDAYTASYQRAMDSTNPKASK